jgi:cytochrome b561
MSWKNTTARYGALSRSLHWLMALLFVAVYAFIELRGIYPKGSDMRDAMKAWHFTMGLSIFVLVWLRIAARFLGETPIIQPTPALWLQHAAKLGHLALYVFMLVMPFLGWLMLSAAGKPILFWGWEWPPLIEENKELAKSIKSVHEVLGKVGYFLIGGHVLAALYHHFILRDNTISHMLPEQKNEGL